MSDVRPGDWPCPSCRANVFASRDKCYRCGAGRAGAQHGAQQPRCQPDARPHNWKPGDWACDGCGASVFASRSSCYRCGVVKPEGAGEEGWDARQPVVDDNPAAGRLVCCLCGFVSPFHRRGGGGKGSGKGEGKGKGNGKGGGGRRAGESAIVFLEEAYLLDQGGGLVALCLGADCSECKRPVCVGCSAFCKRPVNPHAHCHLQ